ncbi:MAG: metallophosphoesterase [Vulcanimicrobiota bacterium]
MDFRDDTCFTAIKDDQRRFIVLSDAHIYLDTHIDKSAPLPTFLNSLLKDAEQLSIIINGDLVDFWRKEPLQAFSYITRFSESYINPLIEKGAQVYYIPGNHDYNLYELLKGNNEGNPFRGLLDKNFHKDLNFLTSKHVIVEQYGKRIFITHGDVIDFLWIFEHLKNINIPDVWGNLDEKIESFLSNSRWDDAYKFYMWIYDRDDLTIDEAERQTFFKMDIGVISKLLLLFFYSSFMRELVERQKPSIQFGLGDFLAPALEYMLKSRSFIEDLKQKFSKVLDNTRIVAPTVNDIALRILFGIQHNWFGKVEGKFDHFIIGHTHHPRQVTLDLNDYGEIMLTDEGSWKEDAAAPYTYAMIENGAVGLWRYDGEKELSEHFKE